jgi:hypothetical protein
MCATSVVPLIVARNGAADQRSGPTHLAQSLQPLTRPQHLSGILEEKQGKTLATILGRALN